jgi:hypothetical protein
MNTCSHVRKREGQRKLEFKRERRYTKFRNDSYAVFISILTFCEGGKAVTKITRQITRQSEQETVRQA